ncbi:MAG TPA: 16S rRNA (guanine(966)-N(2))-methyltransferase RsmD [Myxococcales bacterium]|nr:16S rRNA (guanine(966)-N(2))-methyltransferase RsmD [Myxococcales bacterium]
MNRSTDLQIIAGKYKGKKLASPTEDTVRPPLTRFRRALFDTLMPFLPHGPYLDLFGGSGSFAIEALSRGAPHATIVELNPKTASLIKKNFRKAGVEEPFELLQGDALEWLPKLGEEGKTFTTISVAPPYDQDLEDPILDIIDKYNMLDPHGVLFVQHPTHFHPKLDFKNIECWKTKKYGYTTFTYFYTKDEED